jgi:hypothetical protein
MTTMLEKLDRFARLAQEISARADSAYIHALENNEKDVVIVEKRKLAIAAQIAADKAQGLFLDAEAERYKKLGDHCFSFWIGPHGRAICVRLNRANQEMELSGIRDKEDVRCGAPLNWRVQRGYDLDWSQSDRQMKIAVRQFAKDDDWLQAR